MRIMTWNLWWRHGPWQQRRPLIADTLVAQAPDVCGLQEVWGEEAPGGENLAAELADRLGYHWCWAPLPISLFRQAEHGPDLRIGNAIVSRWPILDQAVLPLPVAQDEEARVALYARIAAPAGELAFFTTHLTHRFEASAERMAQVRALARFVADHSGGCAYPPVVTGDLNAAPDSDELRLLGGLLTAPAVPGMVLFDAWRCAVPGEPGFTWDRRNGHLAGGGSLLDQRIDYVLVGLPRQDRGRVKAAALAGTTPTGGTSPSDHFAVIADLTD